MKTIDQSEAAIIRPLGASNWVDLERLFGPRGACCGCWCMYWRLPRKQFDQNQGEANRLALRQLAHSGRPLGLLAYLDGQAAGWMAIAPRDDYPTMERSRILKRVDAQPVWAISCFFISRPYRGMGLTETLIEASIPFVREHGGTIIEGYPVVPVKSRIAATSAYTGILNAFLDSGFHEVARYKDTRPIVRYVISPE